MRKSTYIIALFTFAIITAVISCKTNKQDDHTSAGITNDSLVKRGAYLVTVGGCDDCHSPKKFGPNGPEVDMDLRFSGYPSGRPFPQYDSNLIKKGIVMFNGDLTSAAGPWGVSFAANISSDETGLANWSEPRFFKALREGKSKGLDGSRTLLPPMPWQNLSNMSDADLKAIFAYLKSTRPVKNIVPETRQLAELK